MGRNRRSPYVDKSRQKRSLGRRLKNLQGPLFRIARTIVATVTIGIFLIGLAFATFIWIDRGKNEQWRAPLREQAIAESDVGHVLFTWVSVQKQYRRTAARVIVVGWDQKLTYEHVDIVSDRSHATETFTETY